MPLYRKINQGAFHMEMRLKTGFTKKIVGLFLEKILYKQQNIKAKFNIKEFKVTIDEGRPHININLEADMEKSDFERLIKQVIEQD